MSDDDLALLRSLAARPVTILPNVFQLRMNALAEQGYVTRTADGWVATQLGCSIIEEKRSTRYR